MNDTITRDTIFCTCDASHTGLMAWVMSQFGKPSGIFGMFVGRIMANSPSNIERNEWAVRLLDVQARDRVLEVGFGPGLGIAAAGRRATQGIVVGLDHSNVMLRQAGRRNAELVTAGRAKLELGSITDCPDFGEPFDRVLSINSVQFWPNPQACAARLHSLMRPGGRIAVVLQPRWRGATDADTVRAGNEIDRLLGAAGFENTSQDFLNLEQCNAVCVLGTA